MSIRILVGGALVAAALMGGPANAAVVCSAAGVPRGCVVGAPVVVAPGAVVARPGAVVVRPGGVVRRGAVVGRPGAVGVGRSSVNRGGPVNRVGRR